jgi:hypothetical protein
MTDTIFALVILSLANLAISVTVSQGTIFEPVRDYLFNRSNRQPYSFLNSLLSCSYCVSHWIAIILIATWQPKHQITGSFGIDLFVYGFAIVGLTTILSSLLPKT